VLINLVLNAARRRLLKPNPTSQPAGLAMNSNEVVIGVKDNQTVLPPTC
jgi:hypothetical protein